MGYDLVFNDQVAVVNPLLRLIGRKVSIWRCWSSLLRTARMSRSCYKGFRYPTYLVMRVQTELRAARLMFSLITTLCTRSFSTAISLTSYSRAATHRFCAACTVTPLTSSSLGPLVTLQKTVHAPLIPECTSGHINLFLLQELSLPQYEQSVCM